MKNPILILLFFTAVSVALAATIGIASAACYSSVQSIPATCDGTITSDTTDPSGCRSITCASGSDSTRILACDKPDGASPPQYFEIYKQSQTGAPHQVCIGSTCILDTGYARSGAYPYCTNQTTPPTPPPPQSCTGVQGLQVTCTGGSVTSDTITGSGCRSVTCSGAGSTLQALACNKPDGASPPQYFEAYKQASSGQAQPQICFGSACVGSSGFATGSFAGQTCANQTQNQTACFSTLQSVPASCSGSITSDAILSNGCRSVACASGSNALQALACNKPGDYAPQYFEMYAQTIAGTPPQLCIGTACVGAGSSYAKSGNYPICMGGSGGNGSGGSGGGSGGNGSGGTPPPGGKQFLWTAAPGYTVDLVASNINLPVNVELAPQGKYQNLPFNSRPMLYVTQLYGRIGMIRNDGSYAVYADNLLNYDPTGQGIPGVGEMGVDGLYIDPNSGDLFASMTYADSGSPTGFYGKVDHFTTNANGDGYTSRTTIVSKIITGPSHFVHTITRGPDGKLYLNTGDASLYDASLLPLSQDKTSPVGKVLRFNDDGSIPSDNPVPGSYMWAGGFRNVFGGAWQPGTSNYFVDGPGTNVGDGIYKATRGAMFGWCCDLFAGAWYTWGNDVAPVQAAFDTGSSGFPASSTGSLYVALSGDTYMKGQDPVSKRIQRFTLNPDGSNAGLPQDVVVYKGQGYGTPIGMAFGPQGLYFTDIYGENGFVAPGVTQGNIYLIHPGDQSTSTLTTPVPSFTTTLSVAPFYPQGLNVVYLCSPTGGSGQYTYTYLFGDRQNTPPGYTQNSNYHTYASHGTYVVGCLVEDTATGQTAAASTTVTV